MTSLPVNDIGLMTPMVNETGSATPQAKGDSKDFMGSLRNAIETQATAVNTIPADVNTAAPKTRPAEPEDREVTQVDRPKNTGRADEKDASVKNEVKKEAGREKQKDISDEKEELSPETVEAITEAVGRIITEVSMELEVTPEEVFTAIEELDLSMTDLLDPSNMADLVTQIAGDADSTVLLTDESLYQTLSDLQEFVADANTDLRTELDLSQEALNEVLVQTEELNGPELTQAIISAPDEEMGEGDYKVTTTVNGEQVAMNVEADASTGVAHVTGVEKQTESHSGDSSDSQGRGKESGHIQGHEITQTVQLNNEINTADVFAAGTDEVAGFRTEASDIANQIMESMKTNISDDVKELEMTLHPASLGNVRVSLVAQNGQVTAQFMAQNETVRAAIESQIVQLRESLEEQGVRIEAVEVTVASHEFDQGSDTAGQHQDELAREEARGRLGGRRRSIDLSAITDESEIAEMEDADRIAAEMMASEGNTVDYTA